MAANPSLSAVLTLLAMYCHHDKKERKPSVRERTEAKTGEVTNRSFLVPVHPFSLNFLMRLPNDYVDL